MIKNLDGTLVIIKLPFQKCMLFDKMSIEATRNENDFTFQTLILPFTTISLLPLAQAIITTHLGKPHTLVSLFTEPLLILLLLFSILHKY